jgi:hypothetical protein
MTHCCRSGADLVPLEMLVIACLWPSAWGPMETFLQCPRVTP